MNFRFNERKAAQAAAFLLREHGGQWDYISLLKEMYIADRIALIERGSVIAGGRMVSMRYGPVLSAVKDCMNAVPPYGAVWAEFATHQKDNLIRLVSTQETFEELSEYEEDVLRRAKSTFDGMTPGQIIDYCHKGELPEWQKPPLGGAGSTDIDPDKILEIAGVPDDERARLREDAAYYADLANRFGPRR